MTRTELTSAAALNFRGNGRSLTVAVGTIVRGLLCRRVLDRGKGQRAACGSSGCDISDVLCEKDLWRRVTVILLLRMKTHSRTHTRAQTDLSDASRLPHRHEQGVSCPLLFLPTGAESLWKLLVNGHLIPPPTACHHLLSRHYSGPLRLPGGVANRSTRIGRAVAALPKRPTTKAPSVTSHSPLEIDAGSRAAISPANADKWRRGGRSGQRSMEGASVLTWFCLGVNT